MNQITVSIQGTAPLMLNNITKANPMHVMTKAIREFSKKRSKTEDDLAMMAKLEWLASLYPQTDGTFIIDGQNLVIEGFGYAMIRANMIEGALLGGAKKFKMGTQFKSAVFCDNQAELDFPDKAPIAQLYGNPRFTDTRAAKLQGKTTIFVTRAIFPEWSLSFKLNYLPDLVNASDIRQALEAAGQQCGIGTYRPQHGRFELTGFKEI